MSESQNAQDLTAEARIRQVKSSLDQLPFIFSFWSLDLDRIKENLEKASQEVSRMRRMLDEIVLESAAEADLVDPPKHESAEVIRSRFYVVE